MAESDSSSPAQHHLRRQLGLRDLVLTQVLCVVGSSWVGVAAGLEVDALAEGVAVEELPERAVDLCLGLGGRVAGFGEEVAVVVGRVGACAVPGETRDVGGRGLRYGDAGANESEEKSAEFHRAIRSRRGPEGTALKRISQSFSLWRGFWETGRIEGQVFHKVAE